MNTMVISAFPGTGKSYFYENNKEISIDSDSSDFSWIEVWSDSENKYIKTQTRHPNFPDNYIEHIKDNLGKVDVIFVSSHKTVREELQKNSIYHIVVYPRFCDKEMFKQRYIERGSPEKFIELVNENWSGWIKDCSVKGFGYDSYEWDFSRYNMEDFVTWLRSERPNNIENFLRG